MWIELTLINALIGLLSFEWAWYSLKPVREVNEERDSQYPAFRRLDVRKW